MELEGTDYHQHDYIGKATHCHTHALMALVPELHEFFDTPTIEILTTVPFGLRSVAADPNRLITCFVDPDIGLDRALGHLGLRFRLRSWDARQDGGQEALSVLQDWLATGSVLLGPVDMSKLPYLFHPELLAGCDHYIVVTSLTPHAASVIDSEGHVGAVIEVRDLSDAWRGAGIPEGRGSFILRQVLDEAKPADLSTLFLRLLPSAIENLRLALTSFRSGPQAFYELAKEADHLESAPSLLRGLTYTIPTRIQRLGFQRRFLSEIYSAVSARGCVNEIVSVIFRQIEVLSDIMADIQERQPPNLHRFNDLGDMEARATKLWLQLL